MKLRLWHLALLVVFAIYVVLATFGVYGGFYLGFPPLTPAWLNNTRIPIERHFRLEHPGRLQVTGEIRQGRVRLVLDDKELAVLLGQLDSSYPLESGEHQLVFENEESAGVLSYSLR